MTPTAEDIDMVENERQLAVLFTKCGHWHHFSQEFAPATFSPSKGRRLDQDNPKARKVREYKRQKASDYRSRRGEEYREYHRKWMANYRAKQKAKEQEVPAL